MTQTNKRVLVRGAGDFATGIIHRLRSAGFAVVATELDRPLAVRRGVALSEAVYEGTFTVEGITGARCALEEIDRVLDAGQVPVVVDPGGRALARDFDIVVDARSAKKNLGTTLDDAPVVVAIGPGFTAGLDCHAVVETLAGGGMGRVLYQGSAAPDSQSPYPLDMTAPCACTPGKPHHLVLRAAAAGIFNGDKEIGDQVAAGDPIGSVTTADGTAHPLHAEAAGVIRGLIRSGTPVERNMKLGDIDPTARVEQCYAISEKSRAIAGGVLEACMTLAHKRATMKR
jgi:xanthine dehydrogenase accessory factor